MKSKEWQITNASLVLPDGKVKPGGLILSEGKITRITSTVEDRDDILGLNLHGMPLYPGFINGHDSLLGTFYRFPAENRPFTNWLAWDNDLKSSELYRERMLLETEMLYLLGAFRNLISGVTTVIDHIPHFVRKAAPADLPVFLLPDFGISHSVCSYSLNWGEGIKREYEKAQKKNIPYITHIAEGFDAESRNSLNALNRAGGLGPHTVLVHGLSLNKDDLSQIKAAGASLVWCPISNNFLYDSTAHIEEMEKLGINICLGTDSCMTGSINLLDEIQYAGRYLEEKEGLNFSPKMIFDMVTKNAARAFRLSDRGVIEEQAVADLVVIRRKYSGDPYRVILEAKLEEIYLVIQNGRPLYGDESLEPIFTEMNVVFDRIKVNGSKKIIVSGLKKLLESINNILGYNKEFSFLPVQ